MRLTEDIGNGTWGEPPISVTFGPEMQAMTLEVEDNERVDVVVHGSGKVRITVARAWELS